MFNWLVKKYTKGYKRVPLFWVNFDLTKYKKDGTKNSCDVYLLPELQSDKFISKHLKVIIDHIRDNYDMDSLVKI